MYKSLETCNGFLRSKNIWDVRAIKDLPPKKYNESAINNFFKLYEELKPTIKQRFNIKSCPNLGDEVERVNVQHYCREVSPNPLKLFALR